ncbi:crotonase/enoyl-CoA hydratase family protein [Alpinimonas psychrophila]|uniref:Enoyl-CoA hydratase/carnithine racemase n=1 Tax=Alpinimonas psychrophila TaxID=748908 RepID=A0A7W3PP84_9MICO|nr:crotonase/enoyl-CoA hydratase family protein [Alpinimonas psychrophila]MBA8829232.1 enoyl-CoA hydratase/carnithine racemase [Alpinimonas psychrophila]
MSEKLVTAELTEHVLHITLNRPHKLNAANRQLLAELSDAFGEIDANPEVRVAVVSAVGPHFTAGLDLGDIFGNEGAGEINDGLKIIPDGSTDPWGVQTAAVGKPIVVAVSGICFTLGVELILAADIAVADTTTTFGQIEVSRGILPFGGATTRFPARVGWGNAMRWLLTGDTFDAVEAHRIGLVQELVPAGEHVERALKIARSIAAQAPLAVQATLANARLAARAAEAQSLALLNETLAGLAQTKDFAAGMTAFATRSTPTFEGH